MHRRQFLKSGGAAGLGLLSAAVLPPLSARAQDKAAVDITLEAKPYLFTPTPTIKVHALAYNGQLPGPLIRPVSIHPKPR